MIDVKILEDSINPNGDRITTGLWTYPRMIHSEIMTHRMLVKNSASSRAIPVEKMIESVRTNPAMFQQYGKANKGMTATEIMDEEETANFVRWWTELGQYVAESCEFQKGKAAKQLINRAMEPWMHMTVVITGTDWDNFFALRAHPAAEPSFQVLAYRWLDLYLGSRPVERDWGEWHLPFVSAADRAFYKNYPDILVKMSTAHCARTSYTKHNVDYSVGEDIKRHDELVLMGHMSPLEHPARAFAGGHPSRYHGCFKGWMPHRKSIQGENITNANLQKILDNKPAWIEL